MNILETVSDTDLVRSLSSTTCPACCGKKMRDQTFCRGDYFKLPTPARQELYRRLGHGYREAVEVVMDTLSRQAFAMPPEDA